MSPIRRETDTPLISYLDDVQLSDGLASGSIKCALFIACSDMGPLRYICSAPQADVLVFQNFGPRVDNAAILALLAEPGVSDLIVYGHCDCLFIRALAKPNAVTQDIRELIDRHFKLDSESLARRYSRAMSADDRVNWRQINEWNVLQQLKSVLIDPAILRRVENGQLQLHGWLLSEDKRLSIFDPAVDQFIEVASALF